MSTTADEGLTRLRAAHRIEIVECIGLEQLGGPLQAAEG
jgi:hypothetical protein